MNASAALTGACVAAAASLFAAGCDRTHPDTPPQGAADVRPVATSGMLADGTTTEAGDDAAVTDRIRAKYFLDPAIKARRIEVETRQGIVTLRGEVASHNERAQALLLARTTEGAERVEDALTVNAAIAPAASAAVLPPATDPVPPPAADEALTARVQALLQADTALASLQVTAKDGVLLIQGTVPTSAAKQRAIELARGADGVIEVVDRIDVG